MLTTLTTLTTLSSLTGCLVTDEIELPEVPQSPPVLSLRDYDASENLILFDRDASKLNELTVVLQIRDEDLTEPLRVRWRIVGKELPPGAPLKYYDCPEREIPGTGSLLRPYTLNVPAGNFARGKCSRVDVIVSSSFKMCKKDRDDGWDITTQEDDAADIGRVSFWVWDISGMNLLETSTAQSLVASCPTVDYRPPSATASTTSATSEGP
jgi:hypothetical protein